MTRGIYIAFLVLAVMIFIGTTVAKPKSPTNALSKIHQDIIANYPDMKHMGRNELEARLSSTEILILDSRPFEEYNVSHIKGAVQIDPDISPEAFRANYGTIFQNKTLVFYCSVGWRSTILADRLQVTALESGATNVQNMEGGLFGWHNDNRPLVNASGATVAIHPYDDYWGRLIENKNNIRSSAAP